MKISIIRSLVSAVAAITCVTGFLVVSSPVSAQQASVATAQSTFSVSVTVPSGGDPITYELKGKTVTVKPGENSTIPANAKKINLPAGTTLTVTSTPAGATTPSTNTYKVDTAVTLSKLSGKVLKENSSAFSLVSQTGDIKLPSGEMIDLINEIRRVAQTAQGAQTPAVSDGND